MTQTNNPDEIEATPLSQLAIKFKHSKSSRERDRLLLEICEYYMPKIRGMLEDIKPCDRDEFIQIYRIEVFKALENWKMNSNFSTYVYMYIRSVYRQFMNSIKMFKLVKDIDEDGNVIKRPIDYSVFSDISEEELESIEYMNELDEEYEEQLNEYEEINAKYLCTQNRNSI